MYAMLLTYVNLGIQVTASLVRFGKHHVIELQVTRFFIMVII